MNSQNLQNKLRDKFLKKGVKMKGPETVFFSKDTKIGKNVEIAPYVGFSDKVQIGNNGKIQKNVSVYDRVILKDDVFCGPSMVFTNVYNPRSAISRKHEYQQTIVMKGASLGANCTIVCGIRVGEHAFIGAGSLVNRAVPAFALMVGVPAKQIGWMSAFGERIKLPLSGKGIWHCSNTGQVYELKDSKVKML